VGELSQKSAGEGRSFDLLKTVGTLLQEAPMGFFRRESGLRSIEFFEDLGFAEAMKVGSVPVSLQFNRIVIADRLHGRARSRYLTIRVGQGDLCRTACDTLPSRKREISGRLRARNMIRSGLEASAS